MDDLVQVGSIGLLNAIERLSRPSRASPSPREKLLNARAVAAEHYAVSLDRTSSADDADGQTVADRFTVTEPGFGAVDDASQRLIRGPCGNG